MKKPDGGPAFAKSMQEGMSLRDYFAASVLASAWPENVRPSFDSRQNIRADEAARLAANCYTLADAMIAEREREID